MASSGAYEDPDDLPGLDEFRIQFGGDVVDRDTSLETDGGGGGYSWMQD